MTTLTVETLLAAIVLLAADQRQVREEPAPRPGAAGRSASPFRAESPPAQPGAKDQTGTRPNGEPDQPAGQWPGMEIAPDVANPFAPAGGLDASRISSVQLGPAAGPGQRTPFNRNMSMPANPFSAVPPGAAAQRPAAVYGAPPGPAPAVGGKAFGDYRPSSPISPYMSLYARPTVGIDNYNAYVRPQLEQRAFDRQVQSTFRTLESDLGMPDLTPRSLGQVPGLFPVGPSVSGAGFMSYQQYFPGYPGPR